MRSPPRSYRRRPDVRPLYSRIAALEQALVVSASENERERLLASERASRAALEASLAQLDAFFAAAPIGLGFLDTELRYLRINQLLADINGLSPTAHIGHTLAELLPELAPTLTPLFRRILATGEAVRDLEVSGSTPAAPGVIRDWLASYYPIPGPAGAPLGLGLIVVDITERKQAAQALDHYVERLQALYAVDRAIIQAHSPTEIAEAALRYLRTIVPAERASVLLYDHDTRAESVLAVSADHPTPTGPEARFALVETDWGSRWEDTQAQIVTDLANDRGVAQLDPHFLAAGWRALLRAPLRARGQIIGSLNLWASRADAFAEPHRAVAQEVGDQLAIAIQHARLFEELSAAHTHLHSLSRRLVEAQEEERRHLARELHDEIGQVLTGLKLGLELVANQASDPLAEALAPLRADIGALIERVRALSLDLRPMMLDDLGLLPALQWHIGRYTAQTRVRVVLRHNGLDRRFPQVIETAAYRVVQEALTNVARYAGVAEVSVRLLADESRLMLRVDDAGAGFVVDEVLAARATGGILGMLERVRLLGGDLTIESAPGAGTQVIAELPLPDAPDEPGRTER